MYRRRLLALALTSAVAPTAALAQAKAAVGQAESALAQAEAAQEASLGVFLRHLVT